MTWTLNCCFLKRNTNKGSFHLLYQGWVRKIEYLKMYRTYFLLKCKDLKLKLAKGKGLSNLYLDATLYSFWNASSNLKLICIDVNLTLNYCAFHCLISNLHYKKLVYYHLLIISLIPHLSPYISVSRIPIESSWAERHRTETMAVDGPVEVGPATEEHIRQH